MRDKTHLSKSAGEKISVYSWAKGKNIFILERRVKKEEEVSNWRRIGRQSSPIDIQNIKFLKEKTVLRRSSSEKKSRLNRRIKKIIRNDRPEAWFR